MGGIKSKFSVGGGKRHGGEDNAGATPAEATPAEATPAEAIPTDGRLKLQQFFFESGREEPRLAGTTPHLVNSEEEVIALVNVARERMQVIRVIGSGHSINEAVGDTGETSNEVLIRLAGELRSFCLVSSSECTKTFKIGGGCYLGLNPLDETSTWDNSVNVQLNNHDCAIPILGGITHQSLGGFIMTGSAGGSVAHGFEDVIKEIHFVNGLGEKVIAVRGTDMFNAVGVSMGMFGVITYVVLEVPTPSFNVKGTEITVSVSDSVIAVDPNTNKSNLQETLETQEYYRMLWYPQEYAQRVTEWAGGWSDSNDIVPYVDILSAPVVAGAAAMSLRWSHWLLTNHPCEATYKLIGAELRLFTKETPQEFNDVWYKVLPMDNGAPVDTIFDTSFTELWFPMDKTDDVLDILRSIYEDQQVAGNYAVEIYAGKSSPFWLSPAYDRDVMRVDPFWFVHQAGDPRQYFDHLWNALLGVEGIRAHWGKYLPAADGVYGDTRYDLAFLKKSYPMLDKWLEMRNAADPDQIFVTEYWRKMFHIEK